MIVRAVKSVAWATAAIVCVAASPSLAGVPAFPTTTVVTASANPITTSQTVGLTATITNAAGQTCTGVVTYEVVGGPGLCGTAVNTAAAGTSTAHVCNQTGTALGGPGTYNIRSTYAGGGTCQASTSANLSVTVLAAAPSAVPTVGEWTMWGLAALLLIGGGAVASRRFNIARET
jgi:hypothetical protein